MPPLLLLLLTLEDWEEGLIRLAQMEAASAGYAFEPQCLANLRTLAKQRLALLAARPDLKPSAGIEIRAGLVELVHRMIFVSRTQSQLPKRTLYEGTLDSARRACGILWWCDNG